MSRTIFKPVLIALLAFSIVGCNSLFLPYFTTVQKIYSLKKGMNVTQVTNTLGVEPYELYYATDGSGMVLMYKYKRQYQKLPSADATKENGLKGGTDRFRDANDLYATFDEEGKLIMMMTSTGLKNTESVLGVESDLYSRLNNAEAFERMNRRQIGESGILKTNKSKNTTVKKPSTDTSAQAPKKKSKAGAIIGGTLAAILVVGAGLLVVLLIFG